jgi:hypothetical protein
MVYHHLPVSPPYCTSPHTARRVVLHIAVVLRVTIVLHVTIVLRVTIMLHLVVVLRVAVMCVSPSRCMSLSCSSSSSSCREKSAPLRSHLGRGWRWRRLLLPKTQENPLPLAFGAREGVELAVVAQNEKESPSARIRGKGGVAHLRLLPRVREKPPPPAFGASEGWLLVIVVGCHL